MKLHTRRDLTFISSHLHSGAIVTTLFKNIHKRLKSVPYHLSIVVTRTNRLINRNLSKRRFRISPAENIANINDELHDETFLLRFFRYTNDRFTPNDDIIFFDTSLPMQYLLFGLSAQIDFSAMR